MDSSHPQGGAATLSPASETTGGVSSSRITSSRKHPLAPPSSSSSSSSSPPTSTSLTIGPQHRGSTVVVVEESFSQRWTSAIDTVRQLICRSLKAITHWSATHPWTTVGSVTFVSIGMILMGIMTNFTIETNGDILWPPQGSTTQLHQDWIRDESQFSEELYHSVLYVTVPTVGDNLLQEPGAYRSVSKVFEIYDSIRNLPDYDDVCGQPYTNPKTNVTMTCEAYGVIEFWNRSTAIFESQVGGQRGDDQDHRDQDTIQQLSSHLFPSGKPVDRKRNFGNPIFESKNDLLVHNEAYRLDLLYPISDTTTEFLAGVIDVAMSYNNDIDNNNNIDYVYPYKVEVFTSRSFDDEFQAAIVKDIPLMPMAFGVMSCFCVLVFAKRDRVKSQALLGWGAVFGVLFSILTGYGLLFTIGIPLTSATQIVVFVMFGIGLDDAFIISGSYRRTDPTKSSVDRIADTIDDVGLSIAITTLTSALAFATGCISSINAVYWLCLYAFPTILIDFFYQITFFVALIVIDDRRMQRHKMDCLVCITVQRNDDDDGDDDNNEKELDHTVQNNGIEEESEHQEETRLAETIKEQPQQDKKVESPPSIAFSSRSTRFMDAYANFLLRPWVKATVLVFFTALLGACIWGATQLKQEMDFKDLVPSDSHVKGYFDAQDEYFENALHAAGYFRFVDQSDPEIRKQMTHYVEDLLAQDAINELPPYFWVRDFETFIAAAANNRTHDEEDDDASLSGATFNQQLDAFLADPLYNQLYGKNIIRDPSTGDIINSRVWLHLGVDLSNAMNMMYYLDLLHEISGSQPVNEGGILQAADYHFFVHDENMNMWEFYAVVPDELTFTTVAGVVSVSIIGVAFIPHWTAVLFVLPSILTVYIDLLGLLHFMGVRINPVSYITLVMSIGLLVDFIMHILLRYYECHDGSREDRVRETLRTMGSSIFVGGVSTLLGVVLLGFSTSTIFTTIFRAFIGLVVLGCSYGLILLPVVLSLVGPEDGYEKPSSSEAGVKESENSMKLSENPDVCPPVLEDSLATDRNRNEMQEDRYRFIDMKDITDEISV